MFGLRRNISGVDSEGIRPNRNAVRIPHAGYPSVVAPGRMPHRGDKGRSGAAPLYEPRLQRIGMLWIPATTALEQT